MYTLFILGTHIWSPLLIHYKDASKSHIYETNRLQMQYVLALFQDRAPSACLEGYMPYINLWFIIIIIIIVLNMIYNLQPNLWLYRSSSSHHNEYDGLYDINAGFVIGLQGWCANK